MSRKWANAKYIAYLGTYLWVELGLQTIHQRSADLIRRGYDLGCFLKAVQELRAGKIRVVTHLIMGLPGESPEDMLETVRYVAELGIWGVKIQLLHVQRRIDNDDKYRFIIQANKAKGSYEFKWNIE